MIELRLLQALSGSSLFGSINIVLYRDFFQLLPISSSLLFGIPTDTKLLEIAGRQAYYAFY